VGLKARTPGPALARWQFIPRPVRDVSAAEELGFRSNLVSALRAGQGLGVEVDLTVGSGAEPSVSVTVPNPESARWMTRVLAPVYGPHQWAPDRTHGTPGDGSAPWATARRARQWPEPFGAPAPSAGVLDSVAEALGAVPSGARLTWSWRPGPLGRVPRWESLPATIPPPVAVGRSGFPLRPDRRIDPVPPPTQRPLFGRLSVTLAFDPSSTARLQAPRIRTALEAVTSSERGNRLVFDPLQGGFGGPLWRQAGFWLSVEEWERMWPRPWCPAPGGGGTSVGGTWMLPLGRTTTGAVVGPTMEPSQGRHLAVLGETGMGKSSLLVAVAHRAFRHGGGVVFDPLGDTVRSLRAALPPDVQERLIWIAPEPGALGLNALEGVGGGPECDPIRSERRLNDLVHALRRVRSGRYEESSYWGPRLEEMVTRAVRAAAAFPEGTLVDAHTLLSTGARLGRPVPGPAIEPVRELADRIRDRPEDADGARRLLHEVVRSPVLVRMVCERQPRRSTRDLVTPGTVVLISGDAAAVGEATARYLLSVYLALVWSELLAREGEPKTFVVLDEAQWFSHESLGEMLRLGRRRNVHVVLATQAVASLPATVAEAVWTNVSDFVAFRGSPDEAREFSRASRSVSTEELLALPRGSAAVLLGKGHLVRWVRTVRRPAPPSVASPSEAARSGGRPMDPCPGAPEDPPAPAVRAADRTQEVLTELVRRAAQLGPGESLVVPLQGLRERVDPSGEGVRRVGSLLGRQGIVSRVDSGPAGPCWVVAAEHRDELCRLGGARPSAASRVPQPS